MKTRKLLAIGACLCGGFLVLAVVAIINAPSASAATVVWDGGGGDNDMTTGANWVGDSAPSEGDDLEFPVTAAKQTINNDFTAGTAFNTMYVSGSGSTSAYSFSGNAIEITESVYDFTPSTVGGSLTLGLDIALNEAAIGMTAGSVRINITGDLSGSGSIFKSGTGVLALLGDNSSLTGAIIINDGTVRASTNLSLGEGSSTVLSSPTAVLRFEPPSTNFTSLSIGEPIYVQAETNGEAVIESSFPVCDEDVEVCDNTLHLTQELVLRENVRFRTHQRVSIDGPLLQQSGSHTVGMVPYTNGTLIVNSSNNETLTPNGTYRSPPANLNLSGNSSGALVYYNVTAFLTGTRQTIRVFPGGTLKGTGSVTETLIVMSGSTLAPGDSPGCLNSGNLTLSGAYEVELGGSEACSGYDQTKVTGTVDLTGSTLTVSLVNDYLSGVGREYVIISNDGSDAVTGTFNGLPEGATFTDGSGVVYTISYVGGDGNDVVLTTQSIPASPDTGFGLIQNNPLLVAGITSACALTIVVIARRYKSVVAKVRLHS